MLSIQHSRNPHLANGLAGSYPVIPSFWPSRAIRRAVKQGREFRLPGPWRAFLTVNPKLRDHIRAL